MYNVIYDVSFTLRTMYENYELSSFFTTNTPGKAKAKLLKLKLNKALDENSTLSYTVRGYGIAQCYLSAVTRHK